MADKTKAQERQEAQDEQQRQEDQQKDQQEHQAQQEAQHQQRRDQERLSPVEVENLNQDDQSKVEQSEERSGTRALAGPGEPEGGRAGAGSGGQGSPANYPITDGQARVQKADEEEQRQREERIAPQREEQMAAGKVEGEELRLAQEQDAIAQDKPAVARERNRPRFVDQLVVTDSGVFEGHFAVVGDGDHEGRYGVFEEVATADDDGYPVTVVLRTRDANAERIVVPYGSLKGAPAGRR